MTREHSSAGSEHLPYKQGVIGSNPIVPTEKPPNRWLFSCPYGKLQSSKKNEAKISNLFLLTTINNRRGE